MTINTRKVVIAVAIILAIILVISLIALLGWSYDPSGDDQVGPVTTISRTR